MYLLRLLLQVNVPNVVVLRKEKNSKLFNL